MRNIYTLLFFVCTVFAYGSEYVEDDEAVSVRDHGSLVETLVLEMPEDAFSQFNLGFKYQHGEEGMSQDYGEAAKWYLKAAEQNHALAQFSLGSMYEHGEGVEQNYAAALYWYQLSAEQGYSFAQYIVGRLYQYGEGVEQNYSAALHWYRLSAEQGSSIAQYCTGLLYALGEGVEKDYTEAVKWYTLSAEQGYARALLKLGDMYLEGKGVSLDVPKALELYAKADKELQLADSLMEEFPIGFFPEGIGATEAAIECMKRDFVSPSSIEGMQAIHGTVDDPIKSVVVVATNEPVRNIPRDISTRIFLKKMTTIEAAQELLDRDLHPVILNFANPSYPGHSQEGAVCNALLSSRYRTKLINASSFIRNHREAFPYTFQNLTNYIPQFGCIYTPVKLKGKEMSVIAAAAYNLEVPITEPKGTVVEKELELYGKYVQEMQRKMRAILLTAQLFRHPSVVLGAWGCNVFNNNPVEMAKLFKHVIQTEFNDVFEEIIFAIPEDKTTSSWVPKDAMEALMVKYRAFENVFREVLLLKSD